MPAFSLADCKIDCGGRQLTGFGESDAVGWKRVSDRWQVLDCCDGESVHCAILNERGEITLTARYDSPINKVLYTLAKAGSSFSFTCTMPNGDVVESAECRVLKDPEPSVGGKTGDYVWVLSANRMRTPYSAGA